MKGLQSLRFITVAAFFLMATAVGAHAQAVSVLYNFGSKAADPLQPSYSGSIAQGRDGDLYTTSPVGGTSGHGTAFKISPSGTLTVLHNFTGLTDGNMPNGGLTLGADGNFYGTTTAGGTCCGVIFKMTPTGTLTVLHTFGGKDGGGPLAAPIQGTDGNFYGTTVGSVEAPNGTIYRMSPAGKLTTIYTFDITHGARPYAPLIQGTDGNFYGTTLQGGSNTSGTVFKVTPTGKLTVLFNCDEADGVDPVAPLVEGSDGNFYGTTFGGGTSTVGTIFRVSPAGTVAVLHNFNFSTDGGRPNAGLIQASDGNLYGAAQQGGFDGFGTVFNIDTGAVNYKVLYIFDQTTGSQPDVSFMQHTNGSLYADTLQGGSGANGVFYGVGGNFAAFASLVARAGKVGKVIGILGQGFTGTTAVSFNGTPAAKFKAVSNTYLTATVPNGATSGPVNVITPGGTLTSRQTFSVIPGITSFNPSSGTGGTPVQILGASFTGATSISFGGVTQTKLTVNSDKQITADVPPGAKTGKITVTTPGGTATSVAKFTVTP
jgi:uncharacterized repeat protein (TIGR03803 family)